MEKLFSVCFAHPEELTIDGNLTFPMWCPPSYPPQNITLIGHHLAIRVDIIFIAQEWGTTSGYEDVHGAPNFFSGLLCFCWERVRENRFLVNPLEISTAVIHVVHQIFSSFKQNFYFLYFRILKCKGTTFRVLNQEAVLGTLALSRILIACPCTVNIFL